MKCQILITLLVLASMFVSGCNQETVIKAQVKEDAPEGLAQVSYTVGKNKIEGHFNFDGQEVFVECAVAVVGELNGDPFSKVFYAKLTAKGTKGGSYDLSCTDPILMQFPSDASNFVGTFSGSSSGYLVIDESLNYLKLNQTDWLTAEPGYKLVLVSFPDDIPDGTYNTDLSFSLGYSRSIDVKTVVTGTLVCDGETYYPPMVPCITNMSQVTPLIIPVSDTLVDVRPELAGLLDDCETLVNCEMQGIGVPALSTWGIVALLLLMTCSAIYIFRRRFIR